MFRFLLLTIVFLVFAYYAAEAVARLRHMLRATERQPAASRDVELVACVACGVHLPRSRALPGPHHAGPHAGPREEPTRFYCSSECRARARGVRQVPAPKSA